MYKAGDKFVQLLKLTTSMANIEQEALERADGEIEDE
jgi:hypothetical protein